MDEDLKKKINDRVQHSITMRMKLAEREESEVHRIISLANTLLGTLGVVAGFGFTAFSYIKNTPIFFLGESLMLGSIFYLAFMIKRQLVDTAIATSNLSYDFQDDTANIKKALLGNNVQELKKFGNDFDDSVKDFSIKPRVIRAKYADKIFNETFVVALLGIFCILISFLNPCLLFKYLLIL